MHPVFKDKTLNEQFERDGYVVMDFLDKGTVQQLLDHYNNTQASMGKPTFSSSLLRHDNNNYRRDVSNTLCNAFKERTDELLDNHKWVLGSYLVKYKTTGSGNGKIPLHQDASLTDESQFYVVNIWCPLVDTDVNNGTLQVVKGSHDINHRPRGYGQGLDEKFPYPEHEDYIRNNYLHPVALKAGQAIICTTKLFHASLPNFTDQPRIVASGVLVPAPSTLYHFYFDREAYKELEVFEVTPDFFMDFPLYDRPDESIFKKVNTLPLYADDIDRDKLDKVLSAPYKNGKEQEAKTQKQLKLRLPAIKGPWQQQAVQALVFLLHQSANDFTEARHTMQFPAQQGFSSGIEWHTADIFQRALITDTLSIFNDWMEGQLLPVISDEADYLLSQQRKDAVGGWAYFPQLPELPADADDLAQVMQALLLLGRKDDIALSCETPLRILLNDQLHEDGSFESWILPKDNLTPLQQKQLEWAKKAWGTGADPEVVSNVLYALHLYDPSRFKTIIAKGVQYIVSAMQSDGYWESTWYFDKYYGTYVAVRLLTATNTTFDHHKVCNFITTSRNSDGGWGTGKSTPLQTAMALLSLYHLYKDAGIAADNAFLQQSLQYLQTTGTTGVWPCSPFIKMPMGRASGHVHHVLQYESHTITASYIAKACMLISSLIE